MPRPELTVAPLDTELEPSAETELLAPTSGRRVRIEASDGSSDQLVIRDANGEVELRVVLTPQGPVLRLKAARVELDADVLGLRCRELEVDVREAARFQAASIHTKTTGDHELEVGGRSHVQARSVAVEAALGSIELRANDDVEVEGERIWLNR